MNGEINVGQLVAVHNFHVAAIAAIPKLLRRERARRAGEGPFVLVKVRHEMHYATGVHTRDDRYGTIFEFIDHTGHVHGQYQVRNPIAHPPENTIGAVRDHDGWYWVIRDAARPAQPSPEAPARCDCTICYGKGVVGPDGEACACVRAGCRKRHGIDDVLDAARKAQAPAPLAKVLHDAVMKVNLPDAASTDEANRHRAGVLRKNIADMILSHPLLQGPAGEAKP